jgi:Swt1-like HEPN
VAGRSLAGNEGARATRKMSSGTQIDITQALKDTENCLRDFISEVMERKFGAEWPGKCGLPSDRIEKWKQRKTEEEKKQKFGTVDPRLIYYADFYDLKTILHKNWSGEFSDALGDWRKMEVWLDQLEDLRNPDAHRRELLPHQKHLALGIEGEIRGRLVRYRSKRETADDYFPRIESIRDNYGNVYGSGTTSIFDCATVLRPGDKLEFVITARDPLDEKLLYEFRPYSRVAEWIESNSHTYVVTAADVGAMFQFSLSIKTEREYHAMGNYDHSVMFIYKVLPAKKQGVS